MKLKDILHKVKIVRIDTRRYFDDFNNVIKYKFDAPVIIVWAKYRGKFYRIEFNKNVDFLNFKYLITAKTNDEEKEPVSETYLYSSQVYDKIVNTARLSVLELLNESEMSKDDC